MTLLELAERCEQATGDSFDLNHEIALALGICSEPFTASLDAAMTLVPEGCGCSVRRFCDGGGNATAYAPETANDPVVAATPALALCAAALKARAHA